MNIFILLAVLALIPIGVALLFFYRALSSRPNRNAPLEERLVFSPGKYRPMERLLDQSDFRFLSTQPGYSPRLGRRFHAERRRLFRRYLRSMRRDFTHLSLALQTLILHSAEDRGDLASGLIRQRMLFAATMLAVEARLLLHAAGMRSVRVDTAGLVQALETIQANTRELLAVPRSSLAGA